MRSRVGSWSGGVCWPARRRPTIADAQAKIQAYAILREQNDLQFTHNLAQIPLGVTVTYANAHGRFSVADNLCGYGFAVIGENGAPVPLRDTAELPGHAVLFTAGNGIPPIRLTGFPPTSPAAEGVTGDPQQLQRRRRG